MEKKTIKRLKTIVTEKNSFKSFFYINKLKRVRTDLNFELIEKNTDENFIKNEKNLNPNYLVIIGLNWKLIKACDIFSFLKPFECQKGGLKRVSIISHTLISQKRVIFSKIKSNFEHGLLTTIKKFENVDGSSKIYALIECDSNKTLKGLYKKCNGIEIGNDHDIIDMRVVTSDLIDFSSVIESVDQIPKNYFPQYLKSSFFLKKENKLIAKKQKELSKGIKNSYFSQKNFPLATLFNRKKKNHKNFFSHLLNFPLVNKHFLNNKINQPYATLDTLLKSLPQQKKL